MCDSPFVLTPQAVWIACNKNIEAIGRKSPKVSIPQAVLIACNSRKSPSRKNGRVVSIPQAVWIACNHRLHGRRACTDLFQYRKRYGLHAIVLHNLRRCDGNGFNTASGMDCMQYRPSQPLGQLNPEAGFLNGSLFWTNRRNLAGFFCRQNRLKTSANPVIPRKLLSTGKI